jgi:hypothetical protein
MDDWRADVAVHATRLERLETDLTDIKQDIRVIRDFMVQTKGGWRALAAAGAVGGAVTATIAKVLPYLTFK